jgi:hypothetical protein
MPENCFVVNHAIILCKRVSLPWLLQTCNVYAPICVNCFACGRMVSWLRLEPVHVAAKLTVFLRMSFRRARLLSLPILLTTYSLVEEIRDGSVGVATGYEFYSRQEQQLFLYSTACRPALGPHHHPAQWLMGALSDGKAAGP